MLGVALRTLPRAPFIGCPWGAACRSTHGLPATCPHPPQSLFPRFLSVPPTLRGPERPQPRRGQGARCWGLAGVGVWLWWGSGQMGTGGPGCSPAPPEGLHEGQLHSHRLLPGGGFMWVLPGVPWVLPLTGAGSPQPALTLSRWMGRPKPLALWRRSDCSSWKPHSPGHGGGAQSHPGAAQPHPDTPSKPPLPPSFPPLLHAGTALCWAQRAWSCQNPRTPPQEGVRAWCRPLHHHHPHPPTVLLPPGGCVLLTCLEIKRGAVRAVRVWGGGGCAQRPGGCFGNGGSPPPRHSGQEALPGGLPVGFACSSRSPVPSPLDVTLRPPGCAVGAHAAGWWRWGRCSPTWALNPALSGCFAALFVYCRSVPRLAWGVGQRPHPPSDAIASPAWPQHPSASPHPNPMESLHGLGWKGPKFLATSKISS